jgi:anti-anti-sigma regulatory factor
MLERMANEGGMLRLFFTGRLDSASTASLQQDVAAVAAYGAGSVVLDFSAVTLIDGTAVAAIAFLFKRLTVDGRALSVAGAVGQPAEVLQQLGIAAMLGVDAPEAVGAPSRPGTGPGRWVNPLAWRVTGW